MVSDSCINALLCAPEDTNVVIRSMITPIIYAAVNELTGAKSNCRRLRDLIRQNCGVTKGLKPTSNTRLQATFSETKKFADALKHYDKKCTAHLKAVKDFNKHTHGFLGLSVPRMFKSSTTGEAMPVESESMVGEGVDFDKIELTGTDGEEKIFKYVQEPLRKWLANFDTVVIALQQVEQLRLTLDSRRRSVSAMEGEITNIKSRTSDPEDSRLMKLVERKHRQEMKMAQVQDDFQRKEATTYQNMRHLVNDVKYVQQHIQKLFELLRQVSSDVHDAFPSPEGHADGHTAFSGDSGFTYGATSDQQYSDHDARTAPIEARFDEHQANQVCTPIQPDVISARPSN